MDPFYEYIEEYKKQLEKGSIKKAYRGLMAYIMDLRTYFKKNILIISCLGVFILVLWI